MNVLNLGELCCMVDAHRATELFKDSTPTFYRKVDEIEKQIELGRYDSYSVIRDPRVKVNFFVYYDYCFNRKRLKNPVAKKYVAKFDPNAIARLYPDSAICKSSDKEDEI